MHLDQTSVFAVLVGKPRVQGKGPRPYDLTSSRIEFFFSSRRRHTRLQGDWSSDVCSSDLGKLAEVLGPSFVERDRIARLLKYRGDMSVEWASYATDTKRIATSFADGINAYEIGRASCRERV